MDNNNQVPQVRGENDLWQGLATSGTIPERYLVRGIDNLGKLYYITRGTAKFGSYIHQKNPTAVKRDTREHKAHEISELDRILNVTVASAVGNNHASFGVSNIQAAQLQPGDVLYTKEKYSYVDGNGVVHFADGFGDQVAANGNNYTFTEVEQMLITAVNSADSAGVGSSTVYVRRCFHGKGRTDYGGDLVPLDIQTLTQITTDYVILRGLPSFPEGGDAPRGFHKNPVIDNNFTQEFKYAIEVTKESSIEKTWLGRTPLQINELLKAKQSVLDLERCYIFGRKGKQRDAAGNMQYTMGGVVEFLLKDTDHIHRYNQPTINYPNITRLLDKIAAMGGSANRDVFLGISLFTELKIAMYSSGYFRYDETATARFDMPVETLVGSGLSLNLYPLYTMEEAGWHNKMLILDADFPHFTPVTHEDWDMKVEKNIQLPGQQIKKDQWVGIKGLERRGAQYLHAIEFPLVTSNIFA